MPTFCRHNRFLERCPICSRDLPGAAPGGRAQGARAPSAGARRSSHERPPRGRTRGGATVRVHREGRAEDDGFRSALVPGVRASADASRLAEEIGFSSGRLLALAADPPGLYGEARALAADDLERATWTCFLIAYLSPLEGEDPFAGVRAALAVDPERGAGESSGAEQLGRLVSLDGIPLGPRTSHDPDRGQATLSAYWQWVGVPRTSPGGGEGPGGRQALAFTGDPSWTPTRRFERLFERLALPGFGRMGRYDLLVTLGRLGIYDIRPDSMRLSGSPGVSAEELTTVAAKRVFGIGDPLLLDRRASALAEAASVPVEALDLALSNWAGPRATMGVPADTLDEGAYERMGEALGL